MTKDEMKIYFNWSSNALLGMDATAADKYLRENYETIRKVADLFLSDYQPREIYRGIIMHENELTELLPHKNMTYLSFSEDFNIAKSFADVNGFGSQYGINHLLGKYGYIVSYTPQKDEILFHHDFIEFFPYIEAWNSIGVDGTEKTLEIQKEVMIKQPEKPFAIKQFF